MDQQWVGRKIVTLSVLAVLGIAYIGFIYSRGTLTGQNHLDGIIGVVLGLYICSHPAANLIDMLFYRRAVRYQLSSRRSAFWWLTLNVLVLLVSGVVIFVGTTQLIGSAD
jgi:hypothetical protein